MSARLLLGISWLRLIALGCKTGVIEAGGPPSDASVDATSDAGVDSPSDAGAVDDGGLPVDRPASDDAGENDGAPDGPPPNGPDGFSCNAALPPEAQLADTSTPTAVVGTGDAASCTYGALAAAIAGGGVITFNCGSAPVTIPVTATLQLPTDWSTVIDGGNTITLDGGGQVRILSWDSPGWMTNANSLTLQRLAIVNGKATPTVAIPPCPAPCSQGFDDGEGGALFMRDGALRVVDVTFTNNRAAELGPDTGGGAIYLQGCQPAFIVGSTFRNNQASNAGAIGTLFAEDNIYNSLFDGNKAVGNGANGDDSSQCSCIHNGQHQVGSGGNGGAIYSDGVAVSVTICGTTITDNTANEFGAAIFFTSNDANQKGTLTIRDSNLTHNTGNGGWEAAPGISTNANFPPPTNSVIQP